MGTIFQEIADSAKDDALLSEMKDIYGRYAFAEDNQLLQIADAFDEFWNKHQAENTMALYTQNILQLPLIL